MNYHFIAIGGSVMHNLALDIYHQGNVVTGSDDEIFEPSKTRLEKAGVLPKELGWFPQKITKDLDAIILGMHAHKDNPELIKALELGIPVYSYPEFIYRQSLNKKRIVVGGSHGKTTITSMIMHVFRMQQKKFDYLVGAQLEGFNTMVKIDANSEIAVFEGDEYLSSILNPVPKFHIYHPHIAIISGIAWDHMNVFPTFENYCEQFAIFIRKIEPGGKLIYCENDSVLVDIVNKNKRADIDYLPYSIPEYEIVNEQTFIKCKMLIAPLKTKNWPKGRADETEKAGPKKKLPVEDFLEESARVEALVNEHFEVEIQRGNSKILEVPLKIFGEHNLMNLEAARLASKSVGIEEDEFYFSMQSFTGAAKRLELIAKTEQSIIYKDFAHSPSKLMATIHAVRLQYPNRKIYAFVELHTYSSLNKDFLEQYKNTMDEADEAIVFYSPHTLELKKLPPIDKEEISAAFDNPAIHVFDSNDDLEEMIKNIKPENSVFLMMSSGNWNGVNVFELLKDKI